MGIKRAVHELPAAYAGAVMLTFKICNYTTQILKL